VKLGTAPFLWIPAESGKYQLFTAMNYLGSPERQKEIGTDVRIMVLIEHHQCTLAGAISSASQKRYEDQECVLQCSRGAGKRRHALQGTARAALWKYLFQMQIFSCRLLPISQAA